MQAACGIRSLQTVSLKGEPCCRDEPAPIGRRAAAGAKTGGPRDTDVPKKAGEFVARGAWVRRRSEGGGAAEPPLRAAPTGVDSASTTLGLPGPQVGKQALRAHLHATCAARRTSHRLRRSSNFRLEAAGGVAGNAIVRLRRGAERRGSVGGLEVRRQQAT
eukprot:364391-Chlamydomonas_euryale.AAC.8